MQAAEIEATRPGRRVLFSKGFLVAASNSKAIAFFTALFPQFLSVGGSSLPQLTAMVAIVGFVAFTVAFTYGIAGAWIQGLVLSRKFIGTFQKVIGGTFVASGIGLAVTRN